MFKKPRLCNHSGFIHRPPGGQSAHSPHTLGPPRPAPAVFRFICLSFHRDSRPSSRPQASPSAHLQRLNRAAGLFPPRLLYLLYYLFHLTLRRNFMLIIIGCTCVGIGETCHSVRAEVRGQLSGGSLPSLSGFWGCNRLACPAPLPMEPSLQLTFLHNL